MESVCSCLIGTEKKNDEAKKTFFSSGNKWDAAKDILAAEYKLNVLSCFKREKRPYRYVYLYVDSKLIAAQN